MKYLRLSFVCGADLPSKLIAWYGNGYGGYSHVDAVLDDGRRAGARNDKVGGMKAGFQIRPPDYEKWIREDNVQLAVSDLEYGLWEQSLMKKIDAPYDKGAILGFILGKDDHDKGHWICSAAQTDTLQEIGKLGKLPVPPSQITPNSLLLMVSAIGWTS